MYQEIPSLPQYSLKGEESQESPISGSKWLKFGAAAGAVGLVGLVAFNGFAKGVSRHGVTLEAAETLVAPFSAGVFSYSSQSEDVKLASFEDFIFKYEKTYANDDEKDLKYKNFKSFLSLIDQRNVNEIALKGTAKHGITKFADLSRDEFKEKYLIHKQKTVFTAVEKKVFTPVPVAKKLTKKVDWTNKLTTGIKEQSGCAASYATAVVQQIESDAIRVGLMTTEDSLSTQQIVSCSTENFGCDGGSVDDAFRYVLSTGGLQSESSYPYSANNAACTYNEKERMISTVELYTLPTEKREDSMADYLLSTGPLTVCVDASDWASYTGGVMKACGSISDLCVQVVGVNMADASGSTRYYTIRNSWGEDWGHSGHLHLQFGGNTCNVANDVTFTETTAVVKK